MTTIGVAELLLGAAVAGAVLFDVFQSVVVPRWTPDHLRLSPALVRGGWSVWRALGKRMPAGDRREDFLGAYAPLALIGVLVAWTLCLIAGYALILHAVRDQIRPSPQDLGTSFYLAGTCVFTLGSDMAATGTAARALYVLAAGSGVAVMAMVVTLLFNLHASFQRREVLVLSLDARAGAPPSGIALLESYLRLGMVADLGALFAAWEAWGAEVLESHRAYSLLPYFRSSHEDESWISALGAVLDAATLILTTVDGVPTGPALLLHRGGVHAVNDLNYWCGGRCGQEVGVERSEWEEGRQRLINAGYEVRDAEQGWRSFSALRAEYAGPLNTLARQFLTPPAQWIGEKPVSHARHVAERLDVDARRLAVTRGCTHLDLVRDVKPRTKGCEECLRTGDRWVHLRLCRICGHVGCCDSSKNKHATAHFHATGHPVIQSIEPGEDWGWCYEDQTTLELA